MLKNNIIDYVNTSDNDSKLKGIFTITGKLAISSHKNIVTSLCTVFPECDKKKDIHYILHYMNLCLQKTFYETIINKIKNNIYINVKKSIINYKSTNMMIDDIIVDNSHGNILLYKYGDNFKIQNDKISDTKKNYSMYTGIFCLDSNMSEYSLDQDGNTIIYLPSKTTPIDYSKYNKMLMPHSFHQSRTKNEFIIFPSESQYTNYKIQYIGMYKLCLQLTFWIRFKIKDTIYPIVSYIQDCSCIYCDKYAINYIQSILDIPFEIVNIIYLYTGNNRNECYCSGRHCYCTCLKCHPDNGKSFCITVFEYKENIKKYETQDDYYRGWE